MDREKETERLTVVGFFHQLVKDLETMKTRG